MPRLKSFIFDTPFTHYITVFSTFETHGIECWAVKISAGIFLKIRYCIFLPLFMFLLPHSEIAFTLLILLCSKLPICIFVKHTVVLTKCTHNLHESIQFSPNIFYVRSYVCISSSLSSIQEHNVVICANGDIAMCAVDVNISLHIQGSASKLVKQPFVAAE